MRAGLVAINLAAVIFGSAALFGKLSLSPFWIVAARGTFACLALGIFSLFRVRLAISAARKSLWLLTITGTLLTIHWLTFFASVQRSGVAVATLTFAKFPIFTVLLKSFKERQTPSAMQLLASFAILVAVGLLKDSKISLPAMQGALVGVLSAFTFAVFGILSQRLTAELDPLTISFFQNLLVALITGCCLPFSPPAPSSSREIFCLVLLGVVTTALMHQLYLFALSKLSAAVCSGFVSLEPVYAIGFAAVFFQEPITICVAVSGALILGASIVLLHSERASIGDSAKSSRKNIGNRRMDT